MTAGISLLFKRITITAFILYVVVYLLSCATHFISSIQCKWFAYLGLGFPYLLVGMLLVNVVSFIFFKKIKWLFLVVLLCGFHNFFSTTGLHFTKNFVQEKKPNTLRLLSWNVDGFLNCEKRADTLGNPRRKILDFIKASNADVLCFQDYQDYYKSNYHYNNQQYIQDTLGYRYAYFSVSDLQSNGSYDSPYGVIIFSKYPFTDTVSLGYHLNDKPEYLQFGTIEYNGKKIRFYNTHLRSLSLKSGEDEGKLDFRFSTYDEHLLTNRSKMASIKYFDSIHIRQAQLIKQQLNQSPYPYVFCADLNSVPSSYTYHIIANGLHDAFLQNGCGWGATYDGISPTLRIDVVLMSKQLNATQLYSPQVKASDHFPNLVDIQLP